MQLAAVRQTLRTHGYSALLYDYVDPFRAACRRRRWRGRRSRCERMRRVILIGTSVGKRG